MQLLWQAKSRHFASLCTVCSAKEDGILVRVIESLYRTPFEGSIVISHTFRGEQSTEHANFRLLSCFSSACCGMGALLHALGLVGDEKRSPIRLAAGSAFSRKGKAGRKARESIQQRTRPPASSFHGFEFPRALAICERLRVRRQDLDVTKDTTSTCMRPSLVV